ncbi:SOS response-associated peptidase [Haloplanus sp. GCM10025708]|uniref:SOS response-associated peptidase n=1 Tax=Haloferacaceae TaxID=1644056 RepID=UPI00360D8BA6
MCGRYTLFTPPPELGERFDVPADEFEPRYNCAPGQSLPVVTDGGRVRRMEWGLTPGWADDAIINARAETVREKPSFGDAFERRRCLVPADGFYEWTDDGPYRVAFEDDRPFAMAGIWTRWTPETTQAGLDDFGVGDSSATDDARESFAVLTTGPNDVVAQLHDRMAVVLDRDAELTWLTGSGDDAESLLKPHPSEELHAYPVSTRVNDPRNDSPELVEAVQR